MNMRKFSSYGPLNSRLHYYAPRTALIQNAHDHLIGEPELGGHYITVWGPRQTGKTWIMQQVAQQIQANRDFQVALITLQSAKEALTDQEVLDIFVSKLKAWFDQAFPRIQSWNGLAALFEKAHFSRPLILIIDEFDALEERFINRFANEFRDMYISRQNQADRASGQKSCLLHGLALIGVRSVLGIENITGSPFNVQRSLPIPNLSPEETQGLFHWYEKESGQPVEPAVIAQVFYQTGGQPGLTCWLGELLTEGFDGYQAEKNKPIGLDDFRLVFAAAVNLLPNNNILNIISKARQEPYRTAVLALFQTGEKIPFTYDDPSINFLYTNGVIGYERVGTRFYVKFSCPFVQKRLFNYFAHALFPYTGKLHEPFEDLSDTLSVDGLDIHKLIRRFEVYLKKNRKWLLKDAPRRKDMRLFEAVYHFSLYRFLCDFLGSEQARVWPEFPTGNGAVDILIQYQGRLYALELKSYTDARGYQTALAQAGRYGKQLGLARICLVFFVESVDAAIRQQYEKRHRDPENQVEVMPVFVETGS